MKISQKQYDTLQQRMEKLLKLTTGIEDTNHPLMIELDKVSDLVYFYEEQHFVIEKPPLVEVIKLRMAERNLKQKDLAQLFEIPASRVSEYLNNKREITLSIARKIHQHLDIDLETILAV